MPTLTLSCAVSADGFLADRSPERTLLSSPEDFEAVLKHRARMDMIVIGAQTLRADDPSLATRGERHIRRRARDGRAPHPVKVVITRSGSLPHDRAFFRDGDGEKIVLTQGETDAPGTVVPLDGDPIDAVLELAKARGLQDIMVEGGAQILRLALPRARWFRLAVSPRTLGLHGEAHLFDPSTFLRDNPPIYSQDFGGTTVHHIDLHRARAHQLMAEAFALSEQCPPSDTAFAVGAVGCDADMMPLATGFSRETGPRDHAEEALLSKLDGTPPHTVICTLEPCLHRASKPMGCAERLVRAGVRRVYYSVAEDETFTRQSGLAYLAEHGVEVVRLSGFDEAFRRANASIYAAS